MSTPFHTFVRKTTTFPHHHNYVHASTWRAWQGPAHLQRDGEGRTETGARPARAFGVTARAGLVLTAASLLARKLEVRSEVGAKPLTLKHAASGNTCTKQKASFVTESPLPTLPVPQIGSTKVTGNTNIAWHSRSAQRGTPAPEIGRTRGGPTQGSAAPHGREHWHPPLT
jgi:hypothetical protein